MKQEALGADRQVRGPGAGGELTKGGSVLWFRWPRPEPSVLSSAFGTKFSPEGGSAQFHWEGLFVGKFRDTTCRQPLLTLGWGSQDG